MARKRRYTLNENSFEMITPEMSYWLGFMVADGCIMTSSGAHLTRICLAGIDKPHIEKYQRFIGSNHPLYVNKTGAIYISTSSKQMYDDLVRWGLMERKTYSDISFISLIPNEYKGYFICGLFDGDGSFIIRNKKVKDKKYGREYNYNQCTVSILSNEQTLVDICEYLQSQGMKYPKITKVSKKCDILYNARWYSKKDVNLFYSIYKSSPVNLDRKMKSMNDYLLDRSSFIDGRCK